MKPEGTISIREFARRLSCSDAQIRKCIGGRIKKGVTYDDAGQPYIIPSVAGLELAETHDFSAPFKNLDYIQSLEAILIQAGKGPPEKKLKAKAAPPPKKIVKPPGPVRLPKHTHTVKDHTPTKVPVEPTIDRIEENEPDEDFFEDEYNEDTGEKLKVSERISKAKLKETLLKNQILELELQKKQGTLVEKESIYRSLFAAGQEIRTAILTVPDKIIDLLLAASNRTEAHNILTDSLIEALEVIVSGQEKVKSENGH